MKRLVPALSLWAVLLMAVVIVASAFLRHTAAGTGCAAGPSCASAMGAGVLSARRVGAARAVDPMAMTAARLAHRVAATAVLAIAVALVVLAWRAPRAAPGAARGSLALLALALGLAVLGVFTPGSRVPAVPMANLLGGFLMLAVAARLARPAARQGLGAPAFVVALLVLVHAASGVLVSTLEAAGACHDARECMRLATRAGWNWGALDPWRAVDASAPAAAALAQVLHRSLLWLTLPAVAALGLLAVLRGRWLEGLALVLLLFVQMALGLEVGAGMPSLAPALWHNAVAAAMLAITLRVA